MFFFCFTDVLEEADESGEEEDEESCKEPAASGINC